jgi:hypothetical protein
MLWCLLLDIPIAATAHDSYLKRAGTPRKPADLMRHTLLGFDTDDTIQRGFAALGVNLAR